jgi:hypothetical protein
MIKPEFFTLITLQSSEGKQENCLNLLKEAFDDPSMTEGEYFTSQEDPEIILAIHKWSSPGVFEEYMEKIKEHELLINSGKNIDFFQVSRWKPVK